MAAIHVLYVVATAVLAAVAMAMASRHVPATGFVAEPSPYIAGTGDTLLDVHRQASGVAHAASAVALPDGRLAAFWFSGSREAAPDVAIRTAIFDGEAWSASRVLIDAAETGRAERRYVKTVGNPVAFRHPGGEYWLIYVSVSVGGWSGSALNLMRSPDGETWGPPTRLVAGPFVNLSTLVKAPPLVREDGLVLLPAYHEFITAYPELLVIDPAGRIVDKVRMGGRCMIQPWLVSTGPQEALALMRAMGCEQSRVWIAETKNGGRTFEPAEASRLANPNAPAAAATLPDGRIVAVLNDTEGPAYTLDLVLSDDGGRSWRHAMPVFDGTGSGAVYRYPWLVRDSDGRLHVLVTEGKDAIRHAAIGAAALDGSARQ